MSSLIHRIEVEQPPVPGTVMKLEKWPVFVPPPSGKPPFVVEPSDGFDGWPSSPT